MRDASALQNYSESNWRNGLRPSGFLTKETFFKEADRDRMRERLREFEGPSNAGKTMILEGSLKYQGLGISPEDAQVLESRKFSVEEIARLFNVPPSVIGHTAGATFHNSGQQSLSFATHSLRPWCKRIEAAFDRDVLADPNLSIELDMTSLTRADDLARWQTYQIATTTNILDTNEVRELEGFRPRPPGSAAAPGGSPPTLPVLTPPTTSAGSLS